jgi:hypothetical protein
MSASLALQRMMVATLTGLVGVSGVYDAPPPDAVSPYVVVGGDVVTDWSTKTGIGHEHRIAINVWEAGPGTARAKAVMAGVETAMRGLSGSRDGHAVVLVQLVRTLVLSDAEDWTQGILEFRVRTIEI